MSNSQNTQPPENPAPSPPERPNLAAGFWTQIPTVVIAILFSFGTSYWQANETQNKLLFRVEQLEKRAETNAGNIAGISTTAQQNAINAAEFRIIQNNVLEQVKDLKQRQAETDSILRNRK